MPPKTKKSQSKSKVKIQASRQLNKQSSKAQIYQVQELSKQEIMFADQFASPFLRFLGLLENAPKDYQETLVPYVTSVASKMFSYSKTIILLSDQLRSKVDLMKKTKITESWSNIFWSFVQIFDLKVFFETLLKEGKIYSLNDYSNAQHDLFNNPGLQLLSKLKFSKVCHPEYFLIEMMAKHEGQNDIGKRFKQKDTMKSRLYKEPRFIEKIAALVHMRENGKHKGSIAMLQYSGNFILGDRVYAIAKENYFEIWQKTSFDYPFPFGRQLAYNLKHIPDEFRVPSDDERSDEEQTYHEIIKPVFDLDRSFKFVGHTGKVLCASFTSDQFFIVTGSADRTVKLWCLRMNILLATFKGHTMPVWDVHFNPSGLYFLSGGAEGMVVLWKTDNPKPQRIFNHQRDIYKVQFAKNPEFAFAAGEEGILFIYNLVHATVEKQIHLGTPIFNFNLGHSGIYIAIITTEGKVIVHNIQQGLTLGSFYFHFQTSKDPCSKKQNIHQVCFSEDEKDIVCLTNKHILIYNLSALNLAIDTSLEDAQYDSAIPQKLISPSTVLMSFDELRFTYCKFTNKNLLLIGGTKYTP